MSEGKLFPFEPLQIKGIFNTVGLAPEADWESVVLARKSRYSNFIRLPQNARVRCKIKIVAKRNELRS